MEDAARDDTGLEKGERSLWPGTPPPEGTNTPGSVSNITQQMAGWVLIAAGFMWGLGPANTSGKSSLSPHRTSTARFRRFTSPHN